LFQRAGHRAGDNTLRERLQAEMVSQRILQPAVTCPALMKNRLYTAPALATRTLPEQLPAGKTTFITTIAQLLRRQFL
jgi:hypothetical protein